MNTVNKADRLVWLRRSGRPYELNDAIDERVHEINMHIRRADGTTLFQRFTEEEAPVGISVR